MAYFRIVPFSLPCWKHGCTLSSDTHCEDLVELLEVKLKKVWGLSYDWVLLAFFSLRLVHTEPSAICQLFLRFCYSNTGSHRDFCWDTLWFSISISLFLQFLGRSHCFGGSKKSCWFFSLFSLLLSRTELRLLSSSCPEP